MKRLWLGAVLLFSTGLWFSPVSAANFEEGVHYRELLEKQPVQTGNKVEVLELFWYRCPHCYSLEAPLKNWLPNIPEGAEFVHMPAILGNNWALHARAYYTFKALGLADQLHTPFFDALHKERRRLNSLDAIADWASANGGPSADVFRDTYNSFAVDSHTRNATQMTQRYDITGVPSIVVGGKYVTTVTMAGSHEQLFTLIEHLIDLSKQP